MEYRAGRFRKCFFVWRRFVRTNHQSCLRKLLYLLICSIAVVGLACIISHIKINFKDELLIEPTSTPIVSKSSNVDLNEEPTPSNMFSNLSPTIQNMYRISTIKLLYDGTSNKNKLSIQTLIMQLEETKIDGIYIHLDVYIFLPRNSHVLRNMKQELNKVKWRHGNITVEFIHKIHTLEWMFYVWNPWETDSNLVAILDAQYIERVSTTWYQFVLLVRSEIANRSDIIGYSGNWDSNERLQIKKSSRRDIKRAPSYILQQGISSAGIFIPHSPERWRFFLSWLQKNRMDWYLWPTLVNVRKKGDQKWIHFNSTIIGSWQQWLSRFARRFDVFVARPAEYFDYGKLLELHSSKKTSYVTNDRPIMLSANGSSITKKSWSRISIDHITKIVEISKTTGGVVSITVVNEAFIDTALSWLCNVDAGGFRPPGIVWIATDKKTYDSLNGISETNAIHIQDMQGGKSHSKFGTPGYWLLMLERVYLVRDILDHGCTVFLFETDQVWMRDPIPYLDRILNEGRSIDLIGTLDGTKEVAGNFLLFRPTLPMRKVYGEVSRLFELEYNRKIKMTTQPNFKTYMNNDQSILSKLILYDLKFRAEFPVIFRILDTDLFVCGKWYDGLNGTYSSARSRSPIIINNNFVSGIEKKTDRLKRFGHWFIINGSCNPNVVRIALRENEFRSPTNSGNFDTMPVLRPSFPTSHSSGNVDGEDIEANPNIVWSALDEERI